MLGTVVLWTTAGIAVAGTAGNAICNGLNHKKAKENKTAIDNNETAIRAVSHEVEGLKKDFAEVKKDFKEMKASLENSTKQTADQYNNLVLCISQIQNQLNQNGAPQVIVQQPVATEAPKAPATTVK